VGRAHGWYGFALKPEDAAGCLDGLRAAGGQVERRPELGELEITVTPRGRLTPARAAAFAELGVDRLVVYPMGANPDEVLAAVDASVAAVAGL
jgi:hypothetical protein